MNFNSRGVMPIHAEMLTRNRKVHMSMATSPTFKNCIMLEIVEALRSIGGVTEQPISVTDALAEATSIPFMRYVVGRPGDRSIKACLEHTVALHSHDGRNTLLLFGNSLEGAVTVVCLEALAYGFDVYLICDLISPNRSELAKFHWERLFQAGAVPTTIEQLIAGWTFSDLDENSKMKLTNVADRFSRKH